MGILSGVWAAEKTRKRFLVKKGYQTSVWKIFWWLIIPALLGARAYHVIDFWQYYSDHWVKILATWEGGMGIWGAIIGGLLGLGAYSLYEHFWNLKGKFLITRPPARQANYEYLINGYLKLADLTAIGLPLGQAIGRLGNFFNQELYGLPARLPWAIYIKKENRVIGFEKFSYFHPLFAYEALLNLLIFLLLLLIARGQSTRSKPGFIFFIYLGLYGLVRFWLEELRINPWRWGALTAGQWLSLLAIIAGMGFVLKTWQNKSNTCRL